MSDSLRIVVLGYIVRGPIGGMAWHHLQYVLGLKALGHEVLFIEDSDDYPSCYDPSRYVVDENPSYGLAFAKQAFDRLGMPEQWAYFDAHTSAWHGPAGPLAVEFCSTAHLAVNVSGVNPLRPWTEKIARRAFVDTDPLFTQVRHLTDPERAQRTANHNLFFTFGELVGTDESAAPSDGIDWSPTRQPISLAAWPVTPGPSRGKLTTIMQWQSYPAVRYAGTDYGMKSQSFEQFWDLPERVGESLEVALGGHGAPRERFRQHGWTVVDSLEVTRDPWSYQRYIADAKAEFSVAKHGYVKSRSGWFSERSACYLASGRPVVVQDTGFSRRLPTGRGILAFSDVASAEDAIEDIAGHYDEHCRAAREICEAYFDSQVVLSSLLERCMNA